MITYDKCRDILREIFNVILPEHGYAVRKEQIALSESILESIHSQKTTLAEAEVGTGKTHAYLVASILAKRGRLNDFWNKTLYPKMPYVDMAYMPIVIATSSIALQKAIVKDYIPELSQILLDGGVIKTPLTAVLRKGREHYVCDRNLDSHIISEQDIKMKRVLNEMLKPSASIDLAEATGLNPHVKRQIRVPARCGTFCPYRETCRYQRFIRKAMCSTIDIQITNHNYLLADVLHRASDSRPLFPNYQIVVIDEAHKLLSAARSMYGAELSDKAALSIINYLKTIKFNTELAAETLYVLAKKLYSESRRLFRSFAESLPDCADDDAERFGVEIDDTATKHLSEVFTAKTYNVGAYVRLSAVDKKQKGDSIENQQAIIAAYCDERPELVIREVYIDNGLSGQTFERPAFKKMLDDIENGLIDCCVSKDLSRYGRSAIDTGYYIEKYFPAHNIRCIAVNDNYDSVYVKLFREKNINFDGAL